MKAKLDSEESYEARADLPIWFGRPRNLHLFDRVDAVRNDSDAEGRLLVVVGQVASVSNHFEESLLVSNQ